MAVQKKKELKEPPLNEAIFELRWENSKVEQSARKSSALLAGIFLEKIKEEYKNYEPLPLSKLNIPDDAVEGVVQHRFRVSENNWPLIQTGSGILTVNETKAYDWKSFKARIIDTVKKFTETYPIESAISNLNLHYINTFPFDFEKENIAEFLKEKMGLSMALSTELFSETGVTEAPTNLNLRFIHSTSSPEGSIALTFASGKNKDSDVLVWDINFNSSKSDVPQTQANLEEWLEQSHSKIETFFFTLGEKILK